MGVERDADDYIDRTRQIERALKQRAARQRRRAIRRYSWPTVLEQTERVIGAAVGP